MDAPAGTVTALLGRNGAGKSTLLKIAAGWLSPDHGFVEVGGHRYLRPRLGTLTRAGVFYLPVGRSILSPASTLEQHLDALEKRFGRSDRASVLERLGIAALAGHPTAALSGGERHRAELSIALLRRPLCLLADEPFRGIDPRDAEVVLEALKSLAQQGAAVVFTGHEVTWTVKLSDRVVWVREGTTHPFGSVSEAAEHWQFRRDYLGVSAQPSDAGDGGPAIVSE